MINNYGGILLLRIYNSLTRRIELFHPLKKDKVDIFTCGPSVYEQPHIGNYRTFLYEDVLQRYLEYLGFSVKRLIAITDIEDKSIAKAEDEGISIQELTEKNIELFFKEAQLLKMRPFTYASRFSTAVDQSVKLIETLVNKGYAYLYEYEGAKNYYYDALRFPGFGKLSRLDTSNWPKKKLRFHKDTYPGMRWNRGDFILWHGLKKGDKVYWDTGIGCGRPSWNIQDPAVITKHLGYTIDIACGGIDNIFRHHDYNIAIMEGVSGKTFSTYWMHGGHLLLDGKKMSKSKGNIIYLEDLFDKGFLNSQIRFFLIYCHYREKLNFTYESLENSCRKLDDFRKMVNNLNISESRQLPAKRPRSSTNIKTTFEENMSNDLSVKSAFDNLYKLLIKMSEHETTRVERQKTLSDLQEVDNVLQVIF